MKRWPVVTAVLVAATAIIGITLYNVYRPAVEADQVENRSMTREEAVSQARAWKPPADMMCTQVMTPATHDDTGAKYTFPTGCIAPGWTRDAPELIDESTGLSDEPAPTDTTPPATLPSYTTRPSAPRPAPAPTPSDDIVEQSTRERASNTADRILAEAKAYRPLSGQKCEEDTTPAIHQASGTRYNFPTVCLPSGWVQTSESQGRGNY